LYQGAVPAPWQATPLVVDGIRYLTQRPNDVVALDARTGRVFWIYQHIPSPDAIVCCGANNRGLAILGDTLFLATHDARLIAIHAKTGRPLWNVKVVDHHEAAYSFTLAPLVVKDKVIVGIGGSDYGIRGFIPAHVPALLVVGSGVPVVLRSRGLEKRWGRGLGHRLVRPRAQLDVLGNR
jgi:glucose dehydrogenase